MAATEGGRRSISSLWKYWGSSCCWLFCTVCTVLHSFVVCTHAPSSGANAIPNPRCLWPRVFIPRKRTRTKERGVRFPSATVTSLGHRPTLGIKSLQFPAVRQVPAVICSHSLLSFARGLSQDKRIMSELGLHLVCWEHGTADVCKTIGLGWDQ